MYWIKHKGLAQWWTEREAMALLIDDYGWTRVSAEAVLKSMRQTRAYRQPESAVAS